ncbi:YbjN domain-containing protein [Deinococcus sp. HMF7604]|uniref:YbjN domain-containing protein n=1 Tax=Deinococcus betulae TaxID=2873312 RepID=UPI001CCA0155|nr:YbjN domain-containing protein [Deinococcus betulae]MBZ9749954.1 YbjN domain-containing protein [Deinococcus betulae]
MKKKLLSAGLLLSLVSSTALAGSAGAPVASQVLASTPTALAAALREAGYKVTVEPVSADSDPTLTVTAGDYEVSLWLSNCKANVCGRATASVSWDYSDDEDSLDLELTNDWNSNYYTQAYIYEGAYYLDSTLFIGGGYTKAALKAWMTEYLDDVSDFEMELP